MRKIELIMKENNIYYQPYLNEDLKCFIPKTECLVIKDFNGDLLVTIDEQVLELKELNRNKRFSKEFDVIPKSTERKKYIPSMTHPGEVKSFLKQVKRSYNKHKFV